MKSSQPAYAPAGHSPAGEIPVTLDASTSGESGHADRILLPLGNALLDAEFTRLGRDLLIESEGERPYLITQYFSQEHLPALVSDTGKQLRPETVTLLSGDPATQQYAGPITETAAPIGMVEKLAGTVHVIRSGEEIELQAGDAVYQNDIIRTDDDGAVGITFIDGSVFSLGGDARMTLDSLIYDASTGEGSSEVTVIKGMFQFISGDIAANNPGDMVIDTPVATIGIRGTTGGGDIQGSGLENHFYLEPNADGTVGWFDVTTEGGTVSMNQPYMQVEIGRIDETLPAPDFTTPEALAEEYAPLTAVMPDGRYEERPESSSLLNMDGGETQMPPSLATAGAPQGDTTAEPTFNRPNDPTEAAVKQFVSEGDAQELLKTATLAQDANLSDQQKAALNDLLAGHTSPQGLELSQSLQEQLERMAHDYALGSDDAESVYDYFGTLQDQIRLGNLPADTFLSDSGTEPDAHPAFTPLYDNALETFTGTSANESFTVNVWANYLNTNAGSIPDILIGGTGTDTLLLNSHTASFSATDINASSSGIDRISFADDSIATLAVTVDDTMVGQSDADALTLLIHDKTTTMDVSGLTDASFSLRVDGESNGLTLTGGSDASILLGGTGMTVTTDDTGALNLTAIGTGHDITLGSSNDTVRLRAGAQTVDAGAGTDRMIITGGSNHMVEGGDGADSLLLNGVDGTTLDGGTGNDRFYVEDATGTTIITGDGDNRIELVDASADISGGTGSDIYALHGSGTVDITESFAIGGSNLYQFAGFAGTANITAFSAASTGNDTLELQRLGGAAQINVALDNSNGTTANVQLDTGGAAYGNQTYNRVGDNLVIGMQNGGDVILTDFFAGKTDYTLLLDSHDLFAPLKNNASHDDTRALDGSYNFTDVKLENSGDTAFSLADGSNLVTVTMTNHGFATGDVITLDGVTAFGNVGTGELNGAKSITVIDANTFTYDIATTSDSDITGGGNTVTLDFERDFYDDITDFVGTTITGAANQAYILGTGGDDVIAGANDNHGTVIHGGDGNDTLTGYEGDILKGGQGEDVLRKVDGALNVTFYGGDDADTHFDIVDYSNQTDYVFIDLNSIAQVNFGAANGDSLYGIEGVRGTANADTFIGADGVGKVNYFDGGAGADDITGGVNARNTVDYQWVTTAINVTLDNNGDAALTHAQAGNDTLTNIQNIIGGTGNDSITGGSQDNILYGGMGNDTLTGGQGADILAGGEGDDILNMGDGSATDTSRDVAMFAGNGGVDTINGFTSTPPSDAATAAQQDAMDLTALLRGGNLAHMNYFDLLGNGLLEVTQNGGDTDVYFDLDGLGGAGTSQIASIASTTATDIDWKHFITHEDATYLTDASGSTTEADPDVIVATGSVSVNGYSGNDIIEILADGAAAINAGSGNDAVVLNDAAILGGGLTIDGGEGIDRLVLNAGALDLSAADTSNISNFEILDLFGNSIDNLKAEDVFNLTGGENTLYIQSSQDGGEFSFDAGTAWSTATADQLSGLPTLPDTNPGDYTTYVADYNGTEVYIHVNNSVTQA